MEVRQEVFDVWPVYDEEDVPVRIAFGESGKLLNVPPPPRRYCVGEHGRIAGKESAGLYLEYYPLATPLKEKVEPARPDSYLSLYNLGVFEARDESLFYQVFGDVVRPVGMEGHDIAVALYCD